MSMNYRAHNVGTFTVNGVGHLATEIECWNACWETARGRGPPLGWNGGKDLLSCTQFKSVQEFVKLELARKLQKAPAAFLIACCLYLDVLNVMGKTFIPELWHRPQKWPPFRPKSAPDRMSSNTHLLHQKWVELYQSKKNYSVISCQTIDADLLIHPCLSRRILIYEAASDHLKS